MATFVGGMQTRLPAGLTNSNIDVMAASTPGGWIRISQDFSTMAPTSAGVTVWQFEPQINYALSKGMRVLLCLTYSPSWIASYHQIPQNGTARTNWANLAAQVVAHYEARAGSHDDPQIAYELWNEPNHGPFNFSPSMATLRPWIRAAILAMRAVTEEAFIVTGGPASATSKVGEYTTRWDQDSNAPAITPTGTSSSTGNGGGSISIATTLDGWFGPPGVAPDGTGLDPGNTPGTAWASAYGIHAYTGVYSPLLSHFGMPIWHAFDDVAGHGSSPYNYWDDIIVAREGNGDKPIWATEQGFHGGAPNFTEQQAADNMYVALARWWAKQGDGKAGPYIYFELFDNKDYGDPSSTTSEDYLGMYRRNFLLPKPQMAVWQAFTKPAAPPPPIDPTDPPTGIPIGGDTRTIAQLFGAAGTTLANYGDPLVVTPPPPDPDPPDDPTDPTDPPTSGEFWAVTVNGVTIGLPPYEFGEDGPNLFGWDSMRANDDPAPGDHGAISENPDLLPALVKDIPVQIWGDSQKDCLQRWKALATAWRPTSVVQQMSLSTPDGQYVLFGRPRRVGPPDLKHLPASYLIETVVQYVATDPRFYSEPKTIVGQVAASEGGLSLPHGFPHGFGKANAGGVNVTNDGNTDTRRLIAIITAGAGGISNPRLELVGTGKFLLLNMNLPDGQALWIDFMARTVKLDGTASRGGVIARPESEFFALPPGTHTIGLGGTGIATISVTVRSASLF